MRTQPLIHIYNQWFSEKRSDHIKHIYIIDDGLPTGEPACAGCMIGMNHYCDETEYLKASQK